MRDFIQSLERKVGTYWKQHWIAPLALVPFLAMWAIHRAFGLSEVMMLNPGPGERFWPFYNPIMVLVFYAGVCLYLANTFDMAAQSKTWMCVKVIGLAIFWGCIANFGFKST